MTEERMSEEAIPQMRERITELEKSLKTEEAARKAAESKARLYEAKDAFRGQGYDPVHAELFVGANPEGDITPELVDGFATKYGTPKLQEGVPPASEGEESTPPSDAGLSGMGRAGSAPGSGGAAPAGQEKLTHQEWMELNKKDPAAALAKARQGLVESVEGNFYSQVLNR